MSNDEAGIVRIADLSVDSRTGELFVGENRVVLQRKVCDLLLQLAARPGELVTRDELYWLLWRGAAAEYASGLDTAVKNLRKALLKGGSKATTIETLPRRGYRLTIDELSSGAPSLLSPGSEADRLYLEGYYCWHKRTPSATRLALRLFQRACDLDPLVARHHSAVAVTRILLASEGDEPPVEQISDAESSAMEAIRLDNTDVTAYCALAYVKGAFEYDLAGALRDLSRAVEMNPNVAMIYMPYSFVLAGLGRLTESREAVERAWTLDPVSPSINALRGFSCYLAGLLDDAVAAGLDATERDPEFGLGHFYYGQALLAAGRYDDALRQFELGAELLESAPPVLAMMGVACVLGGDRNRAQRIDEELEEAASDGYADPYHRALLRDALGRREAAADLMEAAADSHSHWFALALVDPKAQELRTSEAVKPLLRRIRIS